MDPDEVQDLLDALAPSNRETFLQIYLSSLYYVYGLNLDLIDKKSLGKMVNLTLDKFYPALVEHSQKESGSQAVSEAWYTIRLMLHGIMFNTTPEQESKFIETMDENI